jgi:hypothetical protein
MSMVLLAALQGFFGGIAIHLATRALLGARADDLPGGALAIALVAAPWWVSGPTALVGHFASVVACRRIWTVKK